MVSIRSATSVLVLLVGASTQLALGNYFQSVGASSVKAKDVSADGSVVVGATPSYAFRWTHDEGMTILGAGGAWAVSADGSVVVGHSQQSGLSPRACRWTESEGLQIIDNNLNSPFSNEAWAYGVSGSGSVVVGRAQSPSGWQPFRWTATGGMKDMGSGVPYAVSDDGRIVVGGNIGHATEAWRYVSGRWEDLGMLPGAIESDAYGISADGKVIVGSSSGRACMWQESGDIVDLGQLDGSPSYALDASGDGSVIVGYGFTPGSATLSDKRALIWDSAHGIRPLQDVLSRDYGLDTTGWILHQANAVSDDGKTFVGYGTGPDGDWEGWVAVIPEPATIALVALGGTGMVLRRKRR